MNYSYNYAFVRLIDLNLEKRIDSFVSLLSIFKDSTIEIYVSASNIIENCIRSFFKKKNLIAKYFKTDNPDYFDILTKEETKEFLISLGIDLEFVNKIRINRNQQHSQNPKFTYFDKKTLVKSIFNIVVIFANFINEEIVYNGPSDEQINEFIILLKDENEKALGELETSLKNKENEYNEAISEIERLNSMLTELKSNPSISENKIDALDTISEEVSKINNDVNSNNFNSDILSELKLIKNQIATIGILFHNDNSFTKEEIDFLINEKKEQIHKGIEARKKEKERLTKIEEQKRIAVEEKRKADEEKLRKEQERIKAEKEKLLKEQEEYRLKAERKRLKREKKRENIHKTVEVYKITYNKFINMMQPLGFNIKYNESRLYLTARLLATSDYKYILYLMSLSKIFMSTPSKLLNEKKCGKYMGCIKVLMHEDKITLNNYKERIRLATNCIDNKIKLSDVENIINLDKKTLEFRDIIIKIVDYEYTEKEKILNLLINSFKIALLTKLI